MFSWLIFSTISSWLLHEGYGRALAAFKKHVDQNLADADVQMEGGNEESDDILETRRGCDILISNFRDILNFNMFFWLGIQKKSCNLLLVISQLINSVICMFKLHNR